MPTCGTALATTPDITDRQPPFTDGLHWLQSAVRLFNADTPAALAAGAVFPACIFRPGGRRFGIGAEGQLAAHPARSFALWTFSYYFQYRLSPYCNKST